MNVVKFLKTMSKMKKTKSKTTKVKLNRKPTKRRK